MSELIAFFAPTVLPTAAATTARAGEGATAGDSFASVLAALQLAPNADTNLAGANPFATDDIAAKLRALGLTPGEGVVEGLPISAAAKSAVPGLEALLAAVSPGEPATPAKGEAVEPGQLIAAVATALQQVQELPAPPAPAQTSAQPNLALRGTIVAEQLAPAAPGAANAQTSAPQSPEAAADAEAVATAFPGLFAPKQETPQTRVTVPAKPALKPATSAKPVDQAAPQQPNAGAPQLTNPIEGSLARDAGAPAQQQPGTALQQAPAPQTKPADPSSQPTAQAVVVPAPAMPTLIDAQQMSTTVMTTPQAAVPLDALAVHIARKFETGVSQFEIRLHPMELGSLDISLTVADDGRVQAVLRAERPETLDMLQRDARVLEQQLRQAGLEVGSNSLSFSLSSGNGQRPAPFVGWPGFADAQDAAGAAKNDAASTYLAVRKRDGIDIRV